jgi:hypothetical protein
VIALALFSAGGDPKVELKKPPAFGSNAMRCDRCLEPMQDDATVWRISVDYGHASGAMQSWCAICVADRFKSHLPSYTQNWTKEQREGLLRTLAEMPHDRWHPMQSCERCGRPVIFDASRRIPPHTVCRDACRYAVKLAQARARHARRRQPVSCAACGKPFQPKRADALTCSHACRQQAYLERRHRQAAL